MRRAALKKLYAVVPFKGALLSMVRNRVSIPERLYRHLHFHGPFSLDLPGGRSVKVMHFGNQVENDLFWAGFGDGWEGTSLLTWAWLTQGAQCIFDVGANTGIYALSSKAMRPDAHVVAMEPLARIFRRLEENIALNDFAIDAIEAAASNTNGVASIHDPGGDHAYSASLNADMLAESSRSRVYDMKTERLDSVVERLGIPRIDLIKIDVERHEPEVLQGYRGHIARHSPAMLVELLDQELVDRVMAELDGYTLFHIAEGRGIGPALAADPSFGRNYLALPAGDPRIASIGEYLSHDALASLASGVSPPASPRG